MSAGARLLTRTGGPTSAADTDLAARAATGATRLAAAIRSGFGADGYPRHLHGHDPDAAVTFLLPPFAAAADPAVVTAARDRAALLRRPSGGVAPGSAWRADGASWTPETALFALTAAATGDTARAAAGLDWLAGHRTALGSLPEMVRYDGRAASVAPLAWTAALVVLTAARL